MSKNSNSQKETSQKSVASSSQKSSSSKEEIKYSPQLQSAVTELRNLLQTSQGRDKFAQGLNQFRSRKVELSVGFEPLGEILYHALSLCETYHDVHCAKVVMMLSQTFYRDQVDMISSSQSELLLSESASAPTSPLPTLKSKDQKIDSASPSVHSSARSPKSPLLSPQEQHPRQLSKQHRTESISSEPSTARSIHLQERSSRVYLKELLVDHSIWKKKEFWEQILWDCVLDQVCIDKCRHLVYRYGMVCIILYFIHSVRIYMYM